MVLNRVISPPGKHFGHLRPLISMSSMCQKENPLLMRHPFNLKNIWVEVIMPSLTALLPQAPLDEFSNEGPSLRTVLFY
jgi:hypothetical protein